MKKSKLTMGLAVAVIAMGAVSCSDDKTTSIDDFSSYFQVSMPTLVVSDNGSAASYNVDYRVDFSIEKLILSAAPTFGSVGFNFKTEAAKYLTTNGMMSANLGNCRLVQGVASVNDVRLKYNPMPVVPPTTVNNLGLAYYENPWLLVRYEVGSDMKAYTYPLRAAFKGNFKSSYVGGNGQKVSYESTDCMMEYVLDVENRKADVYIYNAKFASPMPLQKVLWLKDLTLRLTDDGLELTGMNVVPYSREGEGASEGFTPYSDFTFNQIEFDIDTPNMTDCEIEFTVAGRFSGEFEGSSIL